MRYIDAENLKSIKSIQSANFNTIGTIREWIDAQPTADVVEVDKAQKEIDYWHDKAQSYEQTILKLSLNKADVVEVVRCKDCKYWVEDGNESFGYAMFCEHDCSLGGQGIKKPDDFCNYGEREDE